MLRVSCIVLITQRIDVVPVFFDHYPDFLRSYDKFRFCKINVDEARKTAMEYGIMSIPTLMFFKDGKKIDEIVGAVPEATLRPKIEALL